MLYLPTCSSSCSLYFGGLRWERSMSIYVRILQLACTCSSVALDDFFLRRMMLRDTKSNNLIPLHTHPISPPPISSCCRFQMWWETRTRRFARLVVHFRELLEGLGGCGRPWSAAPRGRQAVDDREGHVVVGAPCGGRMNTVVSPSLPLATDTNGQEECRC